MKTTILQTNRSPELPAKTTKVSYKEIIKNLCHSNTSDIDSFSEAAFYWTDLTKYAWLVKASERFPKKTIKEIASDCIDYRNSFGFQKDKKLYSTK